MSFFFSLKEKEGKFIFFSRITGAQQSNFIKALFIRVRLHSIYRFLLPCAIVCCCDRCVEKYTPLDYLYMDASLNGV